ncbi:MAG TPA: hypothetical protein VNE39_22435 [Planctomycetota bacterium]|nr:hypothetical protein [Planctomycetota bacterium]
MGIGAAALLCANTRAEETAPPDRRIPEQMACLASDGVGVVQAELVKDADLKLGERSLGRVPAGSRVKVEQVKGEWLWVSSDIDGKRTTGWIHARNVGSRGTKGAPILLLEETHTSRAGQIQSAVVLLRLREKHGLRHIALEGYLRERRAIKADWFAAAAGGDGERRARVAARLLKEGEISNAEFVALAYDDVGLEPIETQAEHSVTMEAEAAVAPFTYLIRIAQTSLAERHVPKLQQFNAELGKLEGEAKQKKLSEMLDYILAADPWTDARAKAMRDVEAARKLSAEQHLARVEEIVERARTRSAELSAEERRAMEANLAFWRGRIAASRTMVESAGRIADQAGVSVVAMIIGAAHTQGMCRMLREQGRPFAVITPLALLNREEASDLPWEMFERKEQRLSVYSEGFMETLLKAFKKPEPVTSEPWLQAKAELYLFTDRIAKAILVPSPPPGGGKPPFGFATGALNGRWVAIDPSRIRIVRDKEEDPNSGRAVLFPAVLNYNDPAKRTEIWVKAGLNSTPVPGRERQSVESMLLDALKEVQKEEGKLDKKVEDKAGRVQVTVNCTAAFATTEGAALRVTIGSI